MGKFTVERTHGFGTDGAKEKLQPMLDKYTSKFGLSANWKGPDTLEAKRTGIKVLFQIGDSNVTVRVDKSFVVPYSDDKIRKGIEDELDKALVD